MKLSAFLQLKVNVFIYRNLRWKFAFFYLMLLGKIYFHIKTTERKKIDNALDTVFRRFDNSFDIKSITKRVFRGIISHYYEKLFNAYADIQRLKAFFRINIKVNGLSKLDSLLKNGKGVLFVTAHYGGIEYIPIFLATNNYPISVILKFATRQLEQTLHVQTKDLGIKLINVNEEKSVFQVITRELKANRIVFIECDEVEEWKPSRKEHMSFLKKAIGVDKTINLILKRTGAEVIFGLMHRFSLKKYTLFLHSYEDILSRSHTAFSSIGEALLKTLEQYIYSYPEQWYQWKNYMDIKAFPAYGAVLDTPAVVPLLKPAFSEVS